MNGDKLNALRIELVKSAEIWQYDLLNPTKFWQFAKDRNIGIYNAQTINDLWRIGLLRADLIRSTDIIKLPGVELASQDGGTNVYCDNRQVEHREGGYGGAISNGLPILGDLEIYFHPFRLYVLYHIARVFDLEVNATQFLVYPHGYEKISNIHIEHLDRWTKSEQFVDRFNYWNSLAELAILLEPIVWKEVFNTIRWRHPDSETGLLVKIQTHYERIEKFLLSISLPNIDELRSELCRAAEIVDGNKILHVLLRLMSSRERLKLKSALGESMLFLSMAEVIRRAAEKANNAKLPEEDELGFGVWFEEARKSLFGTDRIIDASPETRRDFLTSMGLHGGVKARCYVEGETEFAALVSAVGEGGGIEFINLRGQFVQRSGKGLGFANSLMNDKKSHVFSIVLLDADRTDNVRALESTVKREDAFFGRFFLSSPDFEFSNFSTAELIEVALSLTEISRNSLPSQKILTEMVVSAVSSKQLLSILNNAGLSDLQKGEEWGVALMNYALNHPTFSEGGNNAGEERPCLEIVRLLSVCRNAGYLRSLEMFRVDPITGKLLERE